MDQRHQNLDNDLGIKRSKQEKRRLDQISRGSWAFFGVLFLLLFVSLPFWPYSVHWGYYPATGFGISLVLFLVLLSAGAFVVGASRNHGIR